MAYELYHHGILGQKWGKRNGPPYPLSGGDYSKAEKEAKYHKTKKENSYANKRHFDKTIRTTDTLRTLSRDKNRTVNTDMFYATYKTLDKHQYNALFNRKAPETIFDENGNEIGTGQFLKYRIDNNVSKDIKVASEDSAAEVFGELYKNNRDFYNFVTDANRMQSLFVSDKYKFKGYRESRAALESIRNSEKKPTFAEIQKAYRMFNYVIPSVGKDVATQRAKFFSALQKKGYGAVLDTNDAIYGGFKATAPVIVFDMSSIVPKSVKRTTVTSKEFSSLVLAGRKILNV